MLFWVELTLIALHSLSRQHNKNHTGGKLNLGYCCYRHAIHTGTHSQIHMCMRIVLHQMRFRFSWNNIYISKHLYHHSLARIHMMFLKHPYHCQAALSAHTDILRLWPSLISVSYVMSNSCLWNILFFFCFFLD